MKDNRMVWSIFALVGIMAGQVYGAIGDKGIRAMGLAQSYTALARGAEAAFWNPANLGLSGGAGFSWDVLGVGVAISTENNSFSVKDYNDNFTEKDHFITESDKRGLLGDIPGGGLKVNLDAEPILALGVPINGGISFPFIGGTQAAVAVGFTAGFEGEMPKDMFELALFGNDFDRQYDIAEWDGSTWILGSVNLAVAKPWMPTALAPYLGEFAVGGTLKFIGGAYGETLRSDGGFISRTEGADLEAYMITQNAGGTGFGLDLGVAGASKDGRTVFSVGLLNLIDNVSWGIDARQDSLFAAATDLKATDFINDVDEIEDILDNEDIDGDGDADFHKKISEKSFSRSLPAILRLGVAHQLEERLLLVGNLDQSFSEGFGQVTTPRLSGAVEYRLVEWLPARFGLSMGGRGASTAVGFGIGPLALSRFEVRLLEVALATQGGFFPGIAKGSVVAVDFFRLRFE
jgi:hypothetical protein